MQQVIMLLIVGVGAGYLRGEFEALGATFDGRGRLAGEAAAHYMSSSSSSMSRGLPVKREYM